LANSGDITGSDSPAVSKKEAGAYYAFSTSLFVWYSLQVNDAIYLAKKHNADLYKQIYGKDYPIPPKKSIIQKFIDKKEAKKSNSLPNN